MGAPARRGHLWPILGGVAFFAIVAGVSDTVLAWEPTKPVEFVVPAGTTNSMGLVGSQAAKAVSGAHTVKTRPPNSAMTRRQ